MSKDFTNISEKRVFERLKAKGWQLIKTGYPDYFCILPSGEIAFVEVKKGLDRSINANFSNEQCMILTVLHFAGFDTFVATSNDMKIVPEEIINKGLDCLEKRLNKTLKIQRRFNNPDFKDWFDQIINRRLEAKLKVLRVEKAKILQTIQTQKTKLDNLIENRVISEVEQKVKVILKNKCEQCNLVNQMFQSEIVSKYKRSRSVINKYECVACIFTRGLSCKDCTLECRRQGMNQFDAWNDYINNTIQRIKVG